MAWFRCFMCGENFPGQLIGEDGLVGFYVTRFVQAPNASLAEATALDALRAEPKLAPPAGCQSSGIAQVFFEEVAKVPADVVPVVQPGYAWHPMESDA